MASASELVEMWGGGGRGGRAKASAVAPISF